MSWWDEFGKLPITLRNAILSFVVVIPFWLIAIYLLNKPLYNAGDYLIIGAFCFCFSVTWYFLGMLAAAGAAQLDKKKRDTNSMAFVGGIVSVLYLSLAIIVSYYFKWSFITFLIVSYSYMAVVLAKTFIRVIIKDEDEKEAKKKAEKANATS